MLLLVAALLSILVISSVPLIIFYWFQPDDCSLIMAMAVGTLLGDSFLHLIPHALQDGADYVMNWMILLGILVFLGGERLLQHHHGGHEHVGDAGNDEEVHPELTENLQIIAPMVLISDAMHNFIDGMALGISYQTDWETGLSTSLAILLHEVPHELGDMAILREAGYTVKQTIGYAMLSSLTSYSGAMLAWWLGGLSPWWQRALLAFTAGNFIYLSLADLVPTLQRQPHQFKNYLAILFGITVMQIIQFFE